MADILKEADETDAGTTGCSAPIVGMSCLSLRTKEERREAFKAAKERLGEEGRPR